MAKGQLTTQCSVFPLQGDVTSQKSLKQIAETVKREVGIYQLAHRKRRYDRPGLADLKPRRTLSDFVAHVWKTPMADFNAVYGLNCTAVFYIVVVFLELLHAGNKSDYGCKSQVIATASTASFLRNPRAGFAYASSKAALVSNYGEEFQYILRTLGNQV